MINSTKEELYLFCTEKDLSRLYYADFVELLSNMVSEFKVIVSPAQKMPEYADQIDKKRIRIMPDSKCENQCYLVRDHEEVLFFLRNSNHPSHNVFAMWADSRPMVDSVRMLFELCWEKAENIY